MENQYDHLTIVGMMLPQNFGKKNEQASLYLEVESNMSGEFITLEFDPYNFIDWIGSKKIEEIKEFVKLQIDEK